MYDWLATWARVAPAREALESVEDGRVLTYGALNERSCRLAFALREACGIEPGDRVAVLAHNALELFELYFACTKLGALLVPLNWRLAVPELAGILADAEPSVLVYDDAWAETAAALLEGSGVGGAIALGEAHVGAHAGYEALLAEARPAEMRPVVLDAPSHILYTSGTTGRPKGALISHRQVLFNAVNTALACDLTSADACLTFLPLFHTGGLHCLSTPVLHRGGRVVLMRTLDAERAVALLEAGGITTTIAVPTVYQMLRDAGFGRRPARGVRQLLCGGAPLPIPLLEAYHEAGLPLRQGYGLTEVGPNCFSLAPLEGPHRLGSVGVAAFHSQARVVDDEGRDVPPDTPGELWLRGPHVTLGYWRQPEATRAVLDDDGWFHTGDVHRRSEDGTHYVVGRKKEMYISGGENVYPAEVENVLSGHPWVHQVAVLGVEDARWGQVGLAVIVLGEGAPSPLDPEALRLFARARLAGYKVPKHWAAVEAMPLTSSGKIRKDVLASLYGPRPEP
jgi:fatty-acyl-CoA synthase